MSGQCGPLAGAELGHVAVPAVEALLERALDRLHANLTGLVEACTILRPGNGGEPVPDLDTLNLVELEGMIDLIALVIDVEDHLGMPRNFSTASSPYWLREVVRRGRRCLEQRS